MKPSPRAFLRSVGYLIVLIFAVLIVGGFAVGIWAHVAWTFIRLGWGVW